MNKAMKGSEIREAFLKFFELKFDFHNRNYYVLDSFTLFIHRYVPELLMRVLHIPS